MFIVCGLGITFQAHGLRQMRAQGAGTPTPAQHFLAKVPARGPEATSMDPLFYCQLGEKAPRQKPGTQREVQGGRDGADWAAAPTWLVEMPQLAHRVPRSKASQLGLCSRVQKPHSPLLPKPAPRTYNRLPPTPTPGLQLPYQRNHLPGSAVWPSSFLPSTHLVPLVVNSRPPGF